MAWSWRRRSRLGQLPDVRGARLAGRGRADYSATGARAARWADQGNRRRRRIRWRVTILPNTCKEEVDVQAVRNHADRAAKPLKPPPGCRAKPRPRAPLFQCPFLDVLIVFVLFLSVLVHNH
jgi:hypothetical protein